MAYKTRVQLTVLNSAGELIVQLVDEEKNPGTYEIEFDASVITSGEARAMYGGRYVYRLKAGDYSSDKEMEALDVLP